jgi:hypothetical protein
LGRAMKEISTQTLRYNDVFEDDLWRAIKNKIQTFITLYTGM